MDPTVTLQPLGRSNLGLGLRATCCVFFWLWGRGVKEESHCLCFFFLGGGERGIYLLLDQGDPLLEGNTALGWDEGTRWWAQSGGPFP